MDAKPGIPKRLAHSLLNQLAIHPVLVDVGASDAPPAIWDAIASESIYVGFDPDLRDTHEPTGGRFHKTLMINEAITAHEQDAKVAFFLTRAPHCSSMLRPDAEGLRHYLFADLFAVERQTEMAATTLNQVLSRVGLPGIDWLKLDTQGADLQIFNSLAEHWRARILALDIEPGLIDAYVGEDLFIDVHQSLTKQGFWLSNLNVLGSVRVDQHTLTRQPGLTRRMIEHTVRKSPGWCEARYLRTAEWLVEHNASSRDFVLHWIFALLDAQPGFALDLGVAYRQRFGDGKLAELLQDYPAHLIRQAGHVRIAHRARLVLELAQQRLRKLLTTNV